MLDTFRPYAASFLLGLWSAALSAQPVPAEGLLIQVDSTAFASDPQQAVMSAIKVLQTRKSQSGERVLRLPAGRFHLKQPLEFGPMTSGRTGEILVIEGHPLGTVLSGAIQLPPGRAALPRETSGLPPAVVAQVTSYDLPALSSVRLFDSRQGQGRAPSAVSMDPFVPGVALRPAEWPNDAFTSIKEVKSPDLVKLAMTPPVVYPGVWAHGYFGEDWADEWIQVTPSSDASQIGLMGGPALYGAKVGQRIRLVGALEYLDAPGEWYWDAGGSRLHVWLPPEVSDRVIHLPSLETVVSIKDGSYLSLRTLTIEGARGNAVSVQGGRSVTLDRLTIRHAGLLGAKISGLANGIRNSDVQDTGQGGVQLWGGDRSTLTPAELFAVGNRFARFNRWARTYRPAILLGGVGQRVERNLIDGGPHVGILFFGNEHLIAENVLRRLVTEAGDAGAIYTGMDWTARGTTIRHNFLQDIRGPGRHGSRGIYLDDQASGINILGNVFLRVDRPIFLGGGRDNLIDGNFFVQSSPAIHLDDRGLTWQRPLTADSSGLLWRRFNEVPVRSQAWRRYEGLADLPQQEPGKPSGNVARRNAAIDGTPFEFQGAAAAQLAIDRMFDAGSFRWSAGRGAPWNGLSGLIPDEDSAGFRDGFPLLPWRRMACTQARWDGASAGRAPDDDVAVCRP